MEEEQKKPGRPKRPKYKYHQAVRILGYSQRQISIIEKLFSDKEWTLEHWDKTIRQSNI